MSAAASTGSYALSSSDSDEEIFEDVDLGEYDATQKMTDPNVIRGDVRRQIDRMMADALETRKRKNNSSGAAQTPEKRSRASARGVRTPKTAGTDGAAALSRADTAVFVQNTTAVPNDLGVRQKKKLEAMLHKYDLCYGVGGRGWGYSGRGAAPWYAERRDTPEAAIHSKTYYFMCGVTDRLMRFYADYPNSLPPRWITSAEGNDWRLYNTVYKGESLYKELQKYVMNPVVKEYYKSNKKMIRLLKENLDRFLRDPGLHSYVKRLAFVAACGVRTMHVVATAKEQDGGRKLARRIKESLKSLLRKCYYDTSLQRGLGVVIDKLPRVSPLDERDSEDAAGGETQAPGSSDAAKNFELRLRF